MSTKQEPNSNENELTKLWRDKKKNGDKHRVVSDTSDEFICLLSRARLSPRLIFSPYILMATFTEPAFLFPDSLPTMIRMNSLLFRELSKEEEGERNRGQYSANVGIGGAFRALN